MAPPVVRMSAEHSDKLRRLQLLYDAGVLNAENFEEKRQRLLDELQPKPTANPPRLFYTHRVVLYQVLVRRKVGEQRWSSLTCRSRVCAFQGAPRR